MKGFPSIFAVMAIFSTLAAVALAKADSHNPMGIVLRSLDGRGVEVSELLRGKNLLLLEFSASWCPACRRDYPEFERQTVNLMGKYKGLSVAVVLVDRDAWTAKLVKQIWGVNLPLFYSGDELARVLHISFVPTKVLICKDKMGTYRILGGYVGGGKRVLDAICGMIEGWFKTKTTLTVCVGRTLSHENCEITVGEKPSVLSFERKGLKATTESDIATLKEMAEGSVGVIVVAWEAEVEKMAKKLPENVVILKIELGEKGEVSALPWDVAMGRYTDAFFLKRVGNAKVVYVRRPVKIGFEAFENTSTGEKYVNISGFIER